VLTKPSTSPLAAVYRLTAEVDRKSGTPRQTTLITSRQLGPIQPSLRTAPGAVDPDQFGPVATRI
jgi:hypothetical protein